MCIRIRRTRGGRDVRDGRAIRVRVYYARLYRMCPLHEDTCTSCPERCDLFSATSRTRVTPRMFTRTTRDDHVYNVPNRFVTTVFVLDGGGGGFRFFFSVRG